tara:strand:+ start:365 stop:3871 length:3507 start_codon:yes stop_codon:yes gene_type:complete
MSMRLKLKTLFQSGERVTLSGVADGAEGYVLAEMLSHNPSIGEWCYVARDSRRAELLRQSLDFFAPSAEVVFIPAWDCLPYDRVSPTPQVSAQRMTALARLQTPPGKGSQRIILMTANAALQKSLPPSVIPKRVWRTKPGQIVSMGDLVAWLEGNGFLRVPNVRETSEYAVRGGILDLFPPGDEAPIRLDFFGDTLESLRHFDPETQRTTESLAELNLVPASEAILDDDRIQRFRQNYRAANGTVTKDDPLYEAVSEGRRYPGLEHWLGYLEPELVPVLSFLPEAPVVLDHLLDDALDDRSSQIEDHYQTRLEHKGEGAIYRPSEPDLLYLNSASWSELLQQHRTVSLTPFDVLQESHAGKVVLMGGRQSRTFAAERAASDQNVFDALIAHVTSLAEAKNRVLIASWSEGSRDRLAQVLQDHGLTRQRLINSWTEAKGLQNGTVGLSVLEVESGFSFNGFAFIGEQDVLGDRLVRKGKRKRRDADVLTEAASLNEGDFVVHVEHGIAQFAGLQTILAAGAPHDCLELIYSGGDKLFLPVENIELLTRYGSEGSETVLDKLGGVAWQARKSKLKKRIRDMAEALIKVAAARALKTATPLTLDDGVYDEFAARFPYDETDDQLSAIDAIADDLGSGRPMDRLVCGDVGFGKTEVALRAAFIAAMSGRQVAIVVPTTLLARQHFKTFADRFSGLPVNVRHASRLVPAKDLNETKAGLETGEVDIVVGTHALLGKSIQFRDLGLLIIDEEQHFGVRHKERLKELKSDIHVLTLTATPIPRTLQLALTGVRELSLISTPPVDRLAVRTFVSPVDPVTIREALLREHFRGGQSFYVCPRVSDLAERKAFLEQHVPEIKAIVAHGQMPPRELDDVMNAFYDGQYDVLLSTTIVESGLDIPTANTLIIHRAHMFGLAQMYQLRGRVGRSKTRAYALFTVPTNMKLTTTADRRLRVLQSLNSLGAGFELASHDMDIRGAGNLLGEEQSGHIREVGFELYQQMLEEAVAGLKSGDLDSDIPDHWSPQITLGLAVMIPESYVPDLQLRLSLYKRLSALETAQEIDDFGAELIDRFGPLPEEVDHLLKLVFVKQLCRRCNIEKVDAGPKGMVFTLRNGTFPNPAGLIQYIADQGTLAKIRPDQKIVLIRDWPKPLQRLKGAAVTLSQLAGIAEDADQEAA